MFKGGKLLIATKHDKEIVIAPIFEKGLGVYCFIPQNYGYVIFETFSGEVERATTRATMSFTYTCKMYSFSSRKMHPYQKKIEKPGYWDACNP